MLELDLEQPHQLDREPGGAGDADQAELSAAKTFSMSRLAITLPIVARRSPAITTPPSKVSETIVVPCGASMRRPRAAAPRGQQVGAGPTGTR